MRIYLPHLAYTVRVRDRKIHKNSPEWMVMVTEKDNEFGCTIYAKLPIKPKDYGTLIHEIIHVLQFMCFDRGIEFNDEMEHTAYVAQFIFNKITGYSYNER